MPETKLAHRMTPEDAAFLYFEKPDAPLHIGSVATYEGTIPFDQMFVSLNARMHQIPRYRQKAVIPPFYAGHPTWEDDPDFSLSRHLRLVQLPAPGGERQLRELAGEIFAPMLPRDRPLWDMTMVHGLEGDRTAIISRVHHCLVDGVSGIELLLAVLDLVPDPQPVAPPAEPWQPAPPPSPLAAWSDAIFEQWREGIRSATEWQQNLLDPRGQFRALTEFQRAIEVALPNAFRRATPTPWNRPISGRRLGAETEMNFQEVRGIRSRLGGTVNDVILTILGGALGRYLKAHGITTDGVTVRLMIPVNVRSEDEKGALGNRVSMMLPQVPVGIANPADRLVAVRAEMERLKAQDQASSFETFTRLSRNVPAALHALAGMAGIPRGMVNLVCTNVPGPLIPLYCVGHRMLTHHPLVPLFADAGIGVGITSYDKALYIGIMSDPGIIDDVDRIAGFMADEFKLLKQIADVPDSDLPAFPQAPRTNGHATNGHAPDSEAVQAAATAKHATAAKSPRRAKAPARAQ